MVVLCWKLHSNHNSLLILANEIKRDGTYRARLVALGYSKVPGVEFTDNFAPVVNDVTFRIALARMMMEDLNCMLMDAETAFLYGEKKKYIWKYKWV